MSYLSHKDLIDILPLLSISTSLPEHPFATEQVKVCSIDLRCDRVFWIQRRVPGTLDLASTSLMESSPRRHWIRKEISLGHAIKVRPGEMILGRTYERFQIPPTHAGKITGRSSYARLGIEISCTCDLINPGWEGHVPLEIINNLKRSVLIYPLLPIAQIFMMPLSSPASSDYTDRAKFKSKYMNDDGGPSYWWRDALVKQIYLDYLGHRIDQAAIGRLGNQLSKLDDGGIFRLEKFMANRKIGEVDNVDDLILSFTVAEKIAKRKHEAKQWIPRLFSIVLLPTSVGAIYYTDTLKPIHWILFAVTLILGVWALFDWLINNDEPKFLTQIR